jgi:hypothetical protein
MRVELWLIIALVSVIIISGCTAPETNGGTNGDTVEIKECLTFPEDGSGPVNLLRYLGCENTEDCSYIFTNLYPSGLEEPQYTCETTYYETLISDGKTISCTKTEDCYEQLNVPVDISGNIPQNADANSKYSESWKKIFICEESVCKTTVGINNIYKIQNPY